MPQPLFWGGCSSLTVVLLAEAPGALSLHNPPTQESFLGTEDWGPCCCICSDWPVLCAESSDSRISSGQTTSQWNFMRWRPQIQTSQWMKTEASVPRVKSRVTFKRSQVPMHLETESHYCLWSRLSLLFPPPRLELVLFTILCRTQSSCSPVPWWSISANEHMPEACG